LNRRWIACDQSRIAVAITADRISRVVEDNAKKETGIKYPDTDKYRLKLLFPNGASK
jgi:hypothetical protein